MSEYNDYAKKLLGKMVNKDTDFESMDFKSEWDSTLTTSENINAILKKFPTLFSERISKHEVEADVESFFEKEKEEMKSHETEALRRISASVTPNISKYFFTLNKMVEMIAKGYADGLMVVGPTSIGKTHNTIKTLDKTGVRYIYKSGFSTPLKLYHFLYEYKDGYVIFMDDTMGIIDNPKSLAIILPALFSTTGVRTVSWETTSKDLHAPSQFEISSRIIFCLNRIPDDESFRALMSRCLTCELNFSYLEMLQLMCEISKAPHPELTKEERKTIFNFLKDNSSPGTRNFNLRLLNKLESIYLFSKETGDDWRKLAIKLLNSNPEKIFVSDLVKSTLLVGEQIKKFMKETGMGRSTYFRYKKELKIDDKL